MSSSKTPCPDQYEKKMRVGNILHKKQDEKRQPLLAKEVSVPNKTPNKTFNIGGFVESASEMSS